MRFIIGILISLSFAFIGFTQEWKLAWADERVEIYSREIRYQNTVDGLDHQRQVFNYKNLTDKALTITFNRELYYDNSLQLQDKTFQLTIPANQEINYGDERIQDKTFFIFSKDNQGFIHQTLTHFILKNIHISE